MPLVPVTGFMWETSPWVGRGHYDLVVPKPCFMAGHSISEVIAKNFKECCKDERDHLLAAIEFKLIVNPLGNGFKAAIKKDFQKLTLAIDKGQPRSAYMIIFNRARPEPKFPNNLVETARQNPNVKGLYLESIASPRGHYGIYLNEWNHKLRFTQSGSCKR